MRVARVRMTNFRGIESGEIHFGTHGLLVGGNNVGKSTICEALDLVLGLERLSRRPVVNEHDFHRDRYLTEDDQLVEITIEAVLVDLSPEALRLFGERHLRRWNELTRGFVDDTEDDKVVNPGAADLPHTVWALPVVFYGRYDPERDDFEGNTFFAHPCPIDVDNTLEDEEVKPLGNGLEQFSWRHKRVCGFVFLRALRTGNRALSLQRGSLLDTIIRLGESERNQMWGETLSRLKKLHPAIGDISQLSEIRSEVRTRVAQFIELADEGEVTGFFASDLTRDNLRDVVKFFIASRESGHLVPFQKLGTGTINVLVFALLTFIADLKDKGSVIFAMEEPEIALPPHTQRRIIQFVLREMGQAIVTSHSPYVIEQFTPNDIVILDRDKTKLKGEPVNLGEIKPKTFRTQRRQFAEVILSRAVLVVEGSTEAAVLPTAASLLERSMSPDSYSHPDLEGVCIFNAGGISEIPRYGPAFAALGKRAFATYDRRDEPWAPDEQEKMAKYEESWESEYDAVEYLLVNETEADIQRRFLAEVNQRADYPDVKKYESGFTDEEVQKLCVEVLKARKGEAHGYAANLIEHCRHAESLPISIRTVLQSVHNALSEQNETSEASTDLESQSLTETD